MKILRAADYRRMPWKNGGGETREILVSPRGATLDTLAWRVSLATVASDGPFSVFHGIQRTLCVIRGAGIRLQVGGEPATTLLENSPPFDFDGEAASSATLIDGAIVDLNVMSRRGRWHHTVQRLSFDDTLQLATPAGLMLVCCQHGKLLCQAGNESEHLMIEDCAVIDGTAMDGKVSHISLRATGPATALVIELSRE